MKEYKLDFEEKGIYLIDDKIKYDKEEKNYLKQIENIYLFNKAMSPYINNIFPRIGASIGKEINNYEMQIFIIEKYITNLDKKNNLNPVDYYLIKEGIDIINKGKKAIKHIYKNNYIKLIERSMSNYEVCLTRVDENNLKINKEGKIFIRNFSYLTYNLKEHDIYSYIKRLKRKEINKNIDELIDHYIYIAQLNKDSEDYIKGLISYPNETLKILEKYVLRKIDIDENKITPLLEEAISIDNKVIII